LAIEFVSCVDGGDGVGVLAMVAWHYVLSW